MQEENNNSDPWKPLQYIHGIKFTLREIEVMACIFHMRGTSKISALLSRTEKSITSRTVEFHVSNIMRKIGCNSREGIVDFIEKSEKAALVRELYQNLLQHKFPNRPSSLETKILPSHSIPQGFKRWQNLINPLLVIAGLVIVASVFGLWTFQGYQGPKTHGLSSACKTIRSELSVPSETVLLSRPPLLAQLNNILNGTEKIQTVAIVGMGGSGKSILAKLYARTQKADIVWEINAETKETLIASFERLAHALVKTEEEEKSLNALRNISDLKEREEMLLLYVKERLRAYPQWVLLYDNVEKIADIFPFFPIDFNVWGQGKVLITTRDSNIQHNSSIKETCFIGELSSEEKLVLFTKILQKSGIKDFSEASSEKFLKDIPPFPLDVSIAAYYLKATNTSAYQYVNWLKKNNKEFEDLQAKIISEASNYSETRYSIIKLSVQKLLQIHQNFSYFFLVVSLLDSQKIPRILLETNKEEVIIDNFLYHLKKYSLITSQSDARTSRSFSTFSLHRSTQALVGAFLLQLLTPKEKERLLNRMLSALESFYNLYIEQRFSSVCTPHLERFLVNLQLIALPQDLREQYIQRISLILGNIYKRWSRNLILERKHFVQAWNLQKRTHYLPPQKAALLLQELGEVCEDLGNPDEAISYAQIGLTLCDKISHSEILKTHTLKVIGSAYIGKNDFGKAKFCFEEALKTIKPLNFETRKEAESDTYALLGWLHSLTYVNGEKALLGITYLQKALKIVGGDRLFHKEGAPEHPISRYVANHRTTLGDIYCRLGKYQEAWEEGFKEAQYIIDHFLDKRVHSLLKVYIAIGMGEIYLRQGKIELAKKTLQKSIQEAEKLMGQRAIITLSPKIFHIEAQIRLGELKEAYANCLSIANIDRKSQSNSYTLLFLTAHYHGAVIQYKQKDIKAALKHLGDFFKESEAFCRTFLDKNVYNDLSKQGIFNGHLKESLPSQLTRGLQRGLEIFSAIYGSSHPFVQEYVSQCYKASITTPPR